MKIKYFLLTVPLLLLFATTFGQTQNIFDRVIRKDPNLLIFTQKDWNSFTIAAAIDKRTHVSYLISCYGQIVDSVHIADEDYKLIESKQSTPFKHYNAIADKVLSLSETAKHQLRKTGKLNTKWQYTSLISEYVSELKTSPSSLQKIIFLDGLSEYYLIHKWLVNNPNPRNFAEDSATIYLKQDKAKAGSMIIKSDTTLYYNQSSIARIYKAMLLSKEAKLLYYNRDNVLMDSLSLNPKKVSVLLKQKTDVFLLYRGWLETKKQSIEEGIRILDSTNKSYPNTSIQFADNRTSNLNDIIFEAEQSLIKVIDNINLASVPDLKAIATVLHYEYKNTQVNTALLSSLGVGYMSTFTRGEKLYELTDHRGNVMVVVSDKKIQHSSDGATIDYYTADIVSATDYSSFGAQPPGRAYQSEKYRYSLNGQEKSDELNPNLTTAMYWEYDSRIGRRWNSDPKPVVGVSEYSVFDDNPILKTDPNGDCPLCALVGAGVGALVGGGIEIGKQLWNDGKVSNWKAVGGSALQGGITGGVAGLTGGTSLLVTITAAGTANAVGGAVNDGVQGKKITVRSVATDFAVGATFGAVGYGINKLVTTAAAQRVTQQSVNNKLATYLLNETHPEGADKAIWFRKALGFTQDNAEDLAKQIKFDPKTAVFQKNNGYGDLYQQVIPIKGANGKIINTPFNWIIKKDGIAKLVGAIPVKKPK